MRPKKNGTSLFIPKTKVMERLTALWGTHAKLGILTKIGRFFGFFSVVLRLVNF